MNPREKKIYMNRNSLFWGILILIFGAMLFLENIRIIPSGVVWPVVLIFLGIWILVGRNLVQKNTVDQLVIPLADTSKAEIILNHGAGKVNISSSDDQTALLAGSFGGGVHQKIDRVGPSTLLKLFVPSSFWDGFNWMGGSQGLVWDVKLNNQIPIKLILKTGASESNLDLTNIRVIDLRVETGASSTKIMMPANAGLCTTKIEAGAASVAIRIPTGVAGKIRVQSGLSGINIDSNRFIRSGDYYQSPDYASAANKVDIHVETGVGSVSVN
jgi:hypothetical protein